MLRAASFTFGAYSVDTRRSVVTCTYRVTFARGFSKRFTDRLYFADVPPEAWERVPQDVLSRALQSLVLMLGINYWAAFPTKNIHIDGFTLTRAQAAFWNELYLHGLGEFFYLMKMDFHDLIAFPYDDAQVPPQQAEHARSDRGASRALLLNGAGKDSILSAEMLRASGVPFDFFAFAPTPAHKNIGALVGARTISVTRRRDLWLDVYMELFSISQAYPSVSTFTFVAVLLGELLGYDTIMFSNERSADVGNLTYLGLPVNHQWCKSSVAERITNEYIRTYITPHITSTSLLRTYSELEIVKRFVHYPKYLPYVTSCNSYFWLPRPMQYMFRKAYWCKQCPKCVFLFACYAAFMHKEDVVAMFGGDLYAKPSLLQLIRRMLGVEGFKPLDCVGEPEEMILAMEYARRRGEYAGEVAMQVFDEKIPRTYDFTGAEENVLSSVY